MVLCKKNAHITKGGADKVTGAIVEETAEKLVDTPEGSCASWWLWGLVAPGLGRLKVDTTGSSHRGHPASTFR